MGTLIVVVVLMVLGAVLLTLVVLPLLSGSDPVANQRSNMRNIVSSQRMSSSMAAPSSTRSVEGRNTLFESAREVQVKRISSSRLTMVKRLRYAQLKIPPPVFHAIEIAISVLVFFLVRMKLNMVMQCASLMTGPLFMRWLLNLLVDRRFKHFDSDYPAFLLSLVGLLKTGMNPMSAIEAATHGLEEGSLVRHEVELMLERLRFGVPEEKSIGAFGEDIYHPEIELFVQALLLSRRVGGNLSDTLERLAKQVRKRQYFRAQAVAAVGMQRGSIWVIVGILFGMEMYLYYMFPAVVTETFNNPVGWQVWQGGIMVILLGIFWVRQVTKIRV